METSDTGMTVEQLLASKEDEERTKAADAERVESAADGARAQVVNFSLPVDLGYDSGIEDMEKAVYAELAQADSIRAEMDAKAATRQPAAAKAAEERAGAGADARKTAEAGAGAEVMSARAERPVEDSAVTAKGGEVPSGGVKRLSDDVPSPPPKRLRRKPPRALGSCDE